MIKFRYSVMLNQFRKKMNKRLLPGFKPLFLLLAFACINVCAYAQPELFVSILPQKFFVEQLAGDLVKVEVMVGPGMSPATYEPLPLQMARLSRAKSFFAVGLPFEKTLVDKMKSVCPDVNIIDTSAGIKKRHMESFEAIDHHHEHGEDCDHSAGSPDPHIWLDPQLVKIQADNIAGELKRLLPDQVEILEVRLNSFKERLDQITSELEKILAPFKGRPMLVFHPAFGYFADRFGLIQHSIEIEGKDPTPRQMVSIIRKCRAEKIKIIFVQQQFSSKAANAIAESIGGAVVSVNHLEENYFLGLRNLADALSESLSQ